jgi:hypothetical protein
MAMQFRRMCIVVTLISLPKGPACGLGLKGLRLMGAATTVMGAPMATPEARRAKALSKTIVRTRTL